MMKKLKEKYQDLLFDFHCTKFYRKYKDIKYYIHDLFFPYNVVKCKALGRNWIDRDYLLFHAMFQILVDFVELEYPFGYPKQTKGRFKDVSYMKCRINEMNPEDYYWDGITDEEKQNQIKKFNDIVHAKNEILYLYQWYVYSFPSYVDPIEYSADFDFTDNGIKQTSKGFITTDEYFEMEQERELIMNNMLHRILKIRTHLWT